MDAIRRRPLSCTRTVAGSTGLCSGVGEATVRGWSSVTVGGVEEAAVSDEKRMRLRYAGTCRVCAVALPAESHAIYERPTKTVYAGLGDPAGARAACGYMKIRYR